MLVQSINHYPGCGGDDNDINADDNANDHRRAAASEFTLDVGELDGNGAGDRAGWIALSASSPWLGDVAWLDRCLHGNLGQLRRRRYEQINDSGADAAGNVHNHRGRQLWRDADFHNR